MFPSMISDALVAIHGNHAAPDQGLGYGMLLVRFYVNIYYVVICSWAFYYLAMGLRTNLLWQYCGYKTVSA